PEYRLRRDILSREVERVLAEGVELRLSHSFGTDVTLDSLYGQGYEAVFLAIGARRGRLLNLSGASLDGVVNGIDFLLNINLGYKVEIGRRVVVVGGGNVAMDVARVSLRAGLEAEAGVMGKTLTDAARAALRLGARAVTIACLESREEMPAFAEEIEEAIEEGITLRPRVGPVSIAGEDSKAVGLVVRQVSSVFDEAGRFNPSFIPGTEEMLPADTIILAVGQAVDRIALASIRDLALHPGGTVVVDPQTLETSVPGVYAGGDVAFGPRNVIEAVADGRKAATAIHNRLGGKRRRLWRIRFRPADGHLPPHDFYRTPRQRIPTVPADRRTGFTEIETGYDEETARREANRCLRCHIQTIFDSARCIMCGGCVDVCPERCLRMVDAASLQADIDLGPLLETLGGEPALAIIKDEDRCIRCGLCADRCPVHAITMELMEVEEVEIDA
ncbi:MAG: FAD-dependent oxidoreductase, partial [Planctomycetota bacterium]